MEPYVEDEFQVSLGRRTERNLRFSMTRKPGAENPASTRSGSDWGHRRVTAGHVELRPVARWVQLSIRPRDK